MARMSLHSSKLDNSPVVFWPMEEPASILQIKYSVSVCQPSRVWAVPSICMNPAEPGLCPLCLYEPSRAWAMPSLSVWTQQSLGYPLSVYMNPAEPGLSPLCLGDQGAWEGASLPTLLISCLPLTTLLVISPGKYFQLNPITNNQEAMSIPTVVLAQPQMEVSFPASPPQQMLSWLPGPSDFWNFKTQGWRPVLLLGYAACGLHDGWWGVEVGQRWQDTQWRLSGRCVFWNQTQQNPAIDTNNKEQTERCPKFRLEIRCPCFKGYSELPLNSKEAGYGFLRAILFLFMYYSSFNNCILKDSLPWWYPPLVPSFLPLSHSYWLLLAQKTPPTLMSSVCLLYFISCADNHGCCVFVSVTVMSWLEDNV
jgi:hypothetical protein